MRTTTSEHCKSLCESWVRTDNLQLVRFPLTIADERAAHSDKCATPGQKYLFLIGKSNGNFRNFTSLKCYDYQMDCWRWPETKPAIESTQNAMNNLEFAPTNDKLLRAALKEELWNFHRQEPQTRIIEELGITHGAARVDIAVVNGIIHGYELKSDLDTLRRLPDQMRIYNSVLDQVTLVVGKSHLFEAINTVPEWWGITVAKIIDQDRGILFCSIRRAEDNPEKNSVDIASLLWREEALHVLEELGHSQGMRSKPRKVLYERLADILDQSTLSAKVRECLSLRTNWRFEKQCIQGGD